MVEEQDFILGPDPTQKGFAVMPLRRVHFLAGGSGTGKTRWLYQLLDAMYKGKSFMGYQTQWHPVVYCAFDRQVDEQEEIMEAVGLDPSVVPHEFLRVPDLPRDKYRKDDRFEIVTRDLLNKYPGTRILIFDALFIMAAHGEMNNYVIMAEWLQRLGEICRAQDLTIIGVVHTPKQRKGNEITDPRYSAQGSVATGGFSSTQIVIETPSQEDPEKRLIHIYPRNAKEEHIPMVMDERGMLQIDDLDEDSNKYFMETRIFGDMKPGQSLQFREIVEVMKTIKVSKSSTQRYLNQLVAQGLVCKMERGMYGPRSQTGRTKGAGNGKTEEAAGTSENEQSTTRGDSQGERQDTSPIVASSCEGAPAGFSGMAGDRAGKAPWE